MLSPKPMDQIQPNLVCKLLTWMGRAMAKKFGSRPLGRGQKVKYLILITKSISKIFIQSFVCVLTNERYKTFQTGFSFYCLDHAPGVGFGAGVPWWSKFFFSNMVMWHIKSTGMMRNAPGMGLWGTGGALGVKYLFFSNMVMWHIKLTGMTSIT